MNIFSKFNSILVLLAVLHIVLRASCLGRKKHSSNSVVIESVYNDDNYATGSEMRRLCYYYIPSPQHKNDALLSDYNPFMCTHIIVASAKISNLTIEPWSAKDLETYKKVVKLKQKNKELKVMISIAGKGMVDLVKDDRSIAIFSFNARLFLIFHGFDGLDIDWEFPAWPMSPKTTPQRAQFSNLIIQLWNAIKLSSHPPLILSIAVAADKIITDRSYDVNVLSKNVDFVNIMCYDYHVYEPYFPFTGHNAPLHKHKKLGGYFATMNVEFSANYWLEKGMPKPKINVGVPIYGRNWRLMSPVWHHLGSPAVGRGSVGGFISYPDVLKLIKSGAKTVLDEEAYVSYAFKGSTWVSYEDRYSIRQKAKWIKGNDFGGVMTWSLNHDDFDGSQSGRKFDLHQEIWDSVKE